MVARVHQLAKELDVKSTAIVAKCQAEGLEVKNHMSTLSAGLEATIREWFGTGEHITTVEASARVDLEKVKSDKPRRRRKKATDEKKTVATVEKPGAETDSRVAPAPTTEKKTRKPKRVSPRELAEVKEPLEAAPEPARLVPAAHVETESPRSPEKPEAAPDAEAPTKPAPAKAKPEPKPYVPAPAQLRGPRVVRIEQPEETSRPRAGRPKKQVFLEEPAGQPPVGPTSNAPTTRGGRRRLLGQGERSGGEERGTKVRRGGSQKRAKNRGHEVTGGGAGPHEWGDRDLQERQERLAQASATKLRGRERQLAREDSAGTLGVVEPRRIERAVVKEPVTVKDISNAIGVRGGEIVTKLMSMGVMAAINQTIDPDAAIAIALDFGVELLVEPKVRLLDLLQEEFDKEVPTEQLSPRPPVVAFLGHVDHGKTSLLDRIRKSHVAPGEAGGITQHIGSYLYDDGQRRVTFLDTPGHEAFTAMRARGANMTDIVVLVVAADDGVMPQTEEAINHAKAAGVAIVVALNKMDLPDVDTNRVMGQLADKGLLPAEWGGDVEVVQTSAATGAGIDNLIEHLDYVAELQQLQSQSQGPATGWIVEAEMDTGQGVLARLLVKSGTLKPGDVLLSGSSYGRIRRLTDAHGRSAESAGPAAPVAVAGLDSVPIAGERFFVVDDISQAKQIAEEQKSQNREQKLAQRRQVTLENLFSELEAGQIRELNVILKADMQGSADALTKTITEMNTEEVAIRILHVGVGGINESDVLLAEASDGIVIGFQVVAEDHARMLAETHKVEIRLYNVIYQIAEDIKQALEGMLAPQIEEKQLGRAEVRQLFRISRLGVIAGCAVADGVIRRSAKARIIRENVVIRDNMAVESLRRGKDDASEVRSGLECGIKLVKFDDVKVGDIIEVYEMVETSRTLESLLKQ